MKLEKLQLKKKKIRRNPKQKRNMYFNNDTQAAIVEYQEMEASEEKEKLYNSKIHIAFEKLAESLIFVYGFKNGTEEINTIKKDCVSFLYETIHKWDEARGTKAFSYFNVVAKNWLIINSRNYKKNVMRHVSMSDMTYMSKKDKSIIAHSQVAEAPDKIMIAANQRQEIDKVLNIIKVRVSKENEILCINAIIEIFAKIDQLDFLNKRAIYVYVREISGLTPKKLSVAMSSIRKHYRDIVHDKRIIDIF